MNDNKFTRIGSFEVSKSEEYPTRSAGPYKPCLGIGSVVDTDEDVNGRKHVIQLDIDNMDKDPLSSSLTDDLPPGFYISLQNGPESWNITSLTLHTKEQVIETKAAVRVDDPQHLKIGVKRGYWILRLSRKGKRERPQYSQSHFVKSAQRREHQFSAPHAELYAKIYHEEGLRSILPAGEYIRGNLKLERYATRVE
jgi:hypothetical protein